MPFELEQGGPRLDVPNLSGIVFTSCGELLPVRTIRQPQHPVCVPDKTGRTRPNPGVPYLRYPDAEKRKKLTLNTSGLNGDGAHFLLNNLITLKKDQPIDITSEDYSYANYGAIVYEKTADWMERIEQTVGAPAMHNIMQQYFKTYGF